MMRQEASSPGNRGNLKTPNDTKFVYTGIAPRLWARLLFTGLMSYFLWNGLTGEVRTFIENAPEFK